MTLMIFQDAALAVEDLVESGDIVLSERRRVFAAKLGRDTTLDDEKLILAIAATDDDDDDLFIANVQQVEKGEYTTD